MSNHIKLSAKKEAGIIGALVSAIVGAIFLTISLIPGKIIASSVGDCGTAPCNSCDKDNIQCVTHVDCCYMNC